MEVQGAVRLLLDTPSGHALAVTPTTVACHPLQGGPPQVPPCDQQLCQALQLAAL